MSEKRRSFFGWGYENDSVSADELGWFEQAWSKLFQIDHFNTVQCPASRTLPYDLQESCQLRV